MNHLDAFLTGFFIGALIVLVILKEMLILSISFWILVLPLATPAICIVIINVLEGKN